MKRVVEDLPDQNAIVRVKEVRWDKIYISIREVKETDFCGVSILRKLRMGGVDNGWMWVSLDLLEEETEYNIIDNVKFPYETAGQAVINKIRERDTIVYEFDCLKDALTQVLKEEIGFRDGVPQE